MKRNLNRLAVLGTLFISTAAAAATPKAYGAPYGPPPTGQDICLGPQAFHQNTPWDFSRMIPCWAAYD